LTLQTKMEIIKAKKSKRSGTKLVSTAYMKEIRKSLTDKKISRGDNGSKTASNISGNLKQQLERGVKNINYINS